MGAALCYGSGGSVMVLEALRRRRRRLLRGQGGRTLRVAPTRPCSRRAPHRPSNVPMLAELSVGRGLRAVRALIRCIPILRYCIDDTAVPRGGGTGVAGCKLRPQRNGEVAGCRKTRTATSGCRFHGRARPERIPRGTPRRAMQSFEYRSVRYWSKEINGTLTGGRKKYFF